jgi:hypothetical protein
MSSVISVEQHHHLQRIFLRNIQYVAYYIQFSDDLLSELVANDIIGEADRYLIFSSPSPTIFGNSSRVICLFRILREKNRIFSFILFLRRKKNVSHNFWEILSLFQTEISNSNILSPLLSQIQD